MNVLLKIVFNLFWIKHIKILS